MKAAVLYGTDDIRYEEYPTPVIAKGMVKIRVRATGICGSDVPRVLGGGAHFYPTVLGHEFSGDVVETGEDVTKLQTGDRVSGIPLIPCTVCDDCKRGNFSLCKHYSFIGSRVQGAFAEYVVLPETNAIKIGDAVSYEQAALFEPATVAAHALFCADFQPGKRVAILGAGTVGIFAAQWAKIFGAEQVVVFDIDESRLRLAKKLGADETVNTKEKGFEQKAYLLSGGAGFGYVFEAAGAVQTMHMAFELAANKANICFIGTPHENLTFAPEEWEKMNRKEFKLSGSWMSYSAPFPGREWELTSHFFENGALKYDDGLIYRKFSLRDADKAFVLYNAPGQVKGRILLINDEGGGM